MSGKAMSVDYKKILDQELESQEESLNQPSHSFVSIAEKQFTLPDGKSDKGPMRVIILDFTNVNAYFEDAYVPGQHAKPVCTASNKVIGSMIPDEDSLKKQSDDCKSCKQNQFGSKGRGKACRNKVRIAFSAYDADIDAPVLLLDIPPTSITAWTKFITKLKSAYGKHHAEYIIEIRFHPDKSFPALLFDPIEEHNNMEVVMKLREQAIETLKAVA